MANNNSNNFKNGAGTRNSSGSSEKNTNSRNSSTTSARPSSNGSMKDTHAQVPDDSPKRSGPGGA